MKALQCQAVSRHASSTADLPAADLEVVSREILVGHQPLWHCKRQAICQKRPINHKQLRVTKVSLCDFC